MGWAQPHRLERAATCGRLVEVLFDAMERVEPLGDLRFELAGILCVCEYEVLVETQVEPPEEYVRLRIAFVAPGCGPIGRPFVTEDGRPGVHLGLKRTTFTTSFSIAMQSRGAHKSR